MIRARARTRFRANRLKKRAQTGAFQSLQHAAAALRLTARRSIRRSIGPSRAGRPPHTRRGLLRQAILYHADKARTRALIGPSVEFVGRSARPHEHGGEYMGERYPARPFMGPALEKIRPRLPRFWAASVR